MARKRYVIVGDGAAGLTAAAEIRRRDAQAAIGIFCDDPNPGYFRAALTNFLLGELREDQLWAVAPDFYEQSRIERVFTRVLRVDPVKRELWCSGNPTPLRYDGLLVASGARARPAGFAGGHLPGVLTLRTIQDARRIVDTLRGNVQRAAVLGGGPLGLEWAHALLERGIHVTLVERAPRFMPRALDAVASDLLAARLRKAGVDVVLGEEVARAEQGPSGAVAGIVTNSGRRVACDLVAVALGIVPNSELLDDSGVERLPSGAVKVSVSLATSAPGIWAAGDVASVDGQQLGLWEPARHQGRVAGANMCGAQEQYRPGVHYLATRLFDLDFARVGEIDDAEGRTALVDFPRGTGHIAYRKLTLEGGKVRGGLMIGEKTAKVRSIGKGLKRLIDLGADVSQVSARLLDPSFDVAGFLETRRLVAKPEAKPATASAPSINPAKLRGTQIVSMSVALAGLKQRAGTALLETGALAALVGGTPGTTLLPSAAGGSNTSQLPARTSQLPARTSAMPSRTSLLESHTAALVAAEPRRTKMLSIGLHAEAPPPPLASDQPIEARFELQGQALPIVGKLCSIGSSPDCAIRLSDPAVAFVHAQVSQHGGALYLRDAGSQTGTWVNGVSLATAHALRDGDRVLVGRSELVFRSSALGKATASLDAVIALPRLELRSGPSMGLSFVLTSEECLLGSGPQAQLQVFEPSVAALHARVRVYQGNHYLSDLGSASGTFARGARLPAGQELPLTDGELFQLGAVSVAYTRAPTRDRVAAFRPMAKISVTSGAGAGQSASFAERARVGSAADAELTIAQAAPFELELIVHQGAYFARDLSGGRTFKSGSPLGSEWAPLQNGELLLISTGSLLRFEEP
jgi:NADPH-dependent 2,4-dienoyl-CoA reductase/sulfur reductase-like enzyme/pSer/pThr/pTyr-binding forkhead associated (FHA) protein